MPILFKLNSKLTPSYVTCLPWGNYSAGDITLSHALKPHALSRAMFGSSGVYQCWFAIPSVDEYVGVVTASGLCQIHVTSSTQISVTLPSGISLRSIIYLDHISLT